MTGSIVTKVQKKQAAPPAIPALARGDREFEQALIALEDACQRVLDGQFSEGRYDVERLTWQQHFKNIVTPVSLALAEYKGPRRFHYHYRHRADDETILTPVFEPSPLDLLAQVCDHSLAECQSKLVGIHDKNLEASRRMLERALRTFLAAYSEFKAGL